MDREHHRGSVGYAERDPRSKRGSKPPSPSLAAVDDREAGRKQHATRGAEHREIDVTFVTAVSVLVTELAVDEQRASLLFDGDVVEGVRLSRLQSDRALEPSGDVWRGRVACRAAAYDGHEGQENKSRSSL